MSRGKRQGEAVHCCSPCPYLLVWDDGRSVGVVGEEQLPHAKGVLESPLVVLGGPAVELTHQAQGLVRGG